MRATNANARIGQSRQPLPRPGFIATTARIIWVLSLTGSALAGAIIWQARSQCPEPCIINGMTAPQALKGTSPKPR